MEMVPSGTTYVNISAAGTYYAKMANAGTKCYAGEAEADTSGFVWGSSFGSAGSN
jgi:hypothetical protein